MNAQNPEGPKTAAETGPSNGVVSRETRTAAEETPKPKDTIAERSAPPPKSAASRPDQQPQGRFEGVDAKKLQRAIENLVSRIAEARSRGAARARPDDVHAHHRSGIGVDTALRGMRNEEMAASAASPSADRPEPSNPGRHLAALELRMRQIADLAGAPFAEDISADLAALRSRIDRLSRADGMLTNGMETIQRQLSHLRESFDTSSAPVVNRLIELEGRLDDIGEVLSSRHLSVEARSAVEHSCNHILGAIARIEALARQAVVPEGAWDQIATVRARVERLPTSDTIVGLEKRIREVSEQLGKAAERSDRSQDMARIERHLSEIGATTRTAVEEIRERPAYDPTDVRALLQRIETWRGEKQSSDSLGMGTKLDAIARRVDELSRSDQKAALEKIQAGLGELIGVVSAQNANLSGLDLVGLQSRLADICDQISSKQDDRYVETAAAPEVAEAPEVVEADVEPPIAAFDDPHGEDEDQELAKRLAIRFAPQGEPLAPQGEPRGGALTENEPGTDDVSGAFDALQDALETLVGQIPFLERTWEPGGRSSATRQDHGSPSGSLQRQGANVPAGGGDAGGEDAGMPHRSVAAQPTDSPSEPRSYGETATPPFVEPKEASEKPVHARQDVPAASAHPTYADAAHRIGRSSTWRKAKVAVVAANTPKY